MAHILVRDKKESSGAEGGCMILHTLHCRHFVSFVVLLFHRNLVQDLYGQLGFLVILYICWELRTLTPVWGPSYVALVCVIGFLCLMKFHIIFWLRYHKPYLHSWLHEFQSNYFC